MAKIYIVEAIREALDKTEAKSKEMASKIKETVMSAKIGKKYARTVDLEALGDKVDHLTEMVKEIKKKLEN